MMPSLRASTTFASLARRAATSSIRQPLQFRALSTTPARRASQGYGDGKGDPKASKPQEQGSSNAAKQNAEHPGPAPPAEGKGTGAGPTKAGDTKSPEDASASSGGSRSKEAKETGSSPTGGSVGQSGGKSSTPTSGEESGNKPRPMIHDKNVPEPDESKVAEVEQHNKEFEERHDRAPPAEEDKVDDKFWKGDAGGEKN